MDDETRTPLARTGVPGLDDILGGGLTRGRVFLLEGNPGAGKTTIALRFLLEGAAAAETGLYITLSETDAELRECAASHGWTIDPPIEIFELVPPESVLETDQQQSLLYAADIELGETIGTITAAIERVSPARVVIDSLSEIRLLAQSSLRYRRQLLALKHFFARYDATVLLLDDMTSESQDKTVQSVVHGAILLEEMAPVYGGERRRLRVSKYRGRRFRSGYHDFSIRTGGVVVYPRLVAAEHRAAIERTSVASGIAPLDALLGGGVDSGSSTLVLGPSGAGKSTVALQFVVAAIRRGEHAAVFVFEEDIGIVRRRAAAQGVDLEALQAEGRLHLEQVDAAELSPGEFAHRVRAFVERGGAGTGTVIIDSLNGYRQAMPAESALVLHIHELLQFLNRLGVTTFVTLAQHGMLGEVDSTMELTYIADNVVLLRYFEAGGAVRRAVSVIKKRTGMHEETIREYRITHRGIEIGEPLSEFEGVLRGTPVYRGDSAPLIHRDEPE